MAGDAGRRDGTSGSATDGTAGTEDTPPAIHVADLTKTYGQFTAVDRVSFDVEAGSTVGLFGPNGAGKTTLLRMLAGLVRPTEGTVAYGGTRLTPDERGIYRDVGVVTHQSMLYDDLTARENLAFHARLHGIEDVAGRCQTVLETVGLARRASRRPTEFSHGLRKRLSLARALLHDPAVLLLDEPYAGLDQRSVRDLEGVLDGFEDRTVVLTTHDLERGGRRCTRALVLSGGRVRADLAPGSTSHATLDQEYRRAIGLDEPDPRPRPATDDRS